MGYFSARDMREYATEDQALRWHLESNHFPPLPASVLPVAREAIQHAQHGEWETMLPLPDGMRWKDQLEAPVSVCICAWHLEAFLDDEGRQ